MKLLFICTHNRCRSILAEAIANDLSAGQLDARSAGSEPAGIVHPLTLKYLNAKGIKTEGLQSDSWDSFADFSPDCVITVCDSAAAEACPLWMGTTPTIHWGLEDPSRDIGDPDSQSLAFQHCINVLTERLTRVANMLIQGSSVESTLGFMQTLDNSKHNNSK